MQHDELIWSNIGNKNFCAFKASARTQKTSKFCKNEFNLTGFELRQIFEINLKFVFNELKFLLKSLEI